MTVGFRVRDPISGALRLDLLDYTVKIVFSLNLSIAGSGSYNLPGLDVAEATHGVFFIPLDVDNWRDPNPYSERIFNRPMMIRGRVVSGGVSWEVGVGYSQVSWRMIVVKYS